MWMLRVSGGDGRLGRRRELPVVRVVVPRTRAQPGVWAVQPTALCSSPISHDEGDSGARLQQGSRNDSALAFVAPIGAANQTVGPQAAVDDVPILKLNLP